ncbi:MAG: hypothetical protein IKO99_02220 [Bacteroidales bacterium]|nr:hypothetical protein [Bacteroidales bacterium]
MTDNIKNQPVILPAQKVIKKKYVKPDFEVINLEDTPKLLAASGPAAGVSGTMSQGRALSNGSWD